MTGAMLGVSFPNVVLGPILITLFVIELPWFVAAGWNRLSAGLGPYLQTITQPGFALGSAYGAYVARLSKSRPDLVNHWRGSLGAPPFNSLSQGEIP